MATVPQRGFAHFRLGREHLDHLLRPTVRNSRLAPQVLGIAKSLNTHRAGTFQDIAELAGRPAREITGLIPLLRDVFIAHADRSLQALYRAYVAANPMPEPASHQDRLMQLQDVGGEAARIVDEFDWGWLADWLRLDLIGESERSCRLRLSNFAFQVRRVNFRFTYHCNISCRHCYNHSGPAEKGSLDRNAMLAIIAEMPGANVPALNLTGGEPFLYADTVMAAISAARAAGVEEISVYTNGFWARDPAAARAMLARLQAAGLGAPRDHLKVSSGVYHLEFIAFEHILTLAREYHDKFARRLVIDIETPPDAAPYQRQMWSHVSEAGLTGKVDLRFRGVQPIGRGSNLDTGAYRPIDDPCRVIDQVVFDPDGAVRPCCGLNSDNLGVRIGVLGRQSLRSLIKQMQNDPVLQLLAGQPMQSLPAKLGLPTSRETHAGPCHLCQDFLGGVADKAPLAARLFDGQRYYPFWFA